MALSRATLANIWQNVGVIVGLRTVLLVSALAGLTGFWPAILATTILVTLNTFRLRRWAAMRRQDVIVPAAMARKAPLAA